MLTITKSSQQCEYPIRVRYAFESMGVGDSLYLTDYRKAESSRVSAIQYVRRNQLGWRFSIRKMDGGWRLFRIL
jgi:hypothetical protein